MFKTKKVYGIYLIVALIMLICSIYFYVKFTEVTYDIPPSQERYYFRLLFNPKANVFPFLIYYDFDSKTGNITFENNANITPEIFLIELPKELNITDITIESDFGVGLKENEHYIKRDKSNNKTTRIDLKYFNRSIEDFDFTVSFEGELTPNALFEVSVEDLGRAQTDGGRFFQFNMGDYDCRPDWCLGSYLDKYRMYYYDYMGSIVTVLRVNKDGERVDPQYEQFYLNAKKSEKQIYKKDLFLALSTMFFGIFVPTLLTGIYLSFRYKKEIDLEEVEYLSSLTMRELRQICNEEGLRARSINKYNLIIKILKERKNQ